MSMLWSGPGAVAIKLVSMVGEKSDINLFNGMMHLNTVMDTKIYFN